MEIYLKCDTSKNRHQKILLKLNCHVNRDSYKLISIDKV